MGSSSRSTRGALALAGAQAIVGARGQRLKLEQAQGALHGVAITSGLAMQEGHVRRAPQGHDLAHGEGKRYVHLLGHHRQPASDLAASEARQRHAVEANGAI